VKEATDGGLISSRSLEDPGLQYFGYGFFDGTKHQQELRK